MKHIKKNISFLIIISMFFLNNCQRHEVIKTHGLAYLDKRQNLIFINKSNKKKITKEKINYLKNLENQVTKLKDDSLRYAAEIDNLRKRFDKEKEDIYKSKRIMSNKITIYLASPRGFCAGVDRAIAIVKKTIKKYGIPVYVRHEIVHNTQVVENLKKLGAIFVEELEEVRDRTRPVIFSAHGVPKSVPKEASNMKMFYIDATCPLVTKVHREAERHNKNGNKIILIGHKNHPEVIGTMGILFLLQGLLENHIHRDQKVLVLNIFSLFQKLDTHFQ